MTYLLDTTTVSALLRSERGPSRRLLAAAPGEVGVAGPALAELRYGLARLPRSRRRRELEDRLTILLEGLERMPWNDDVSWHFGATKAELERRGTRLDDFDLAIAAHALAFDATLVTSNTRHFERVPGLSLEDWALTGVRRRGGPIPPRRPLPHPRAARPFAAPVRRVEIPRSNRASGLSAER